jgi:predicted amidophosphoribosyltransferase
VSDVKNLEEEAAAMKVSLKKFEGPWDQGWVLDKHIISSTYLGENEFGHPVFDTVRTEVGEATFQLKYRQDWDQIKPLAEGIAQHIFPKFKDVGFIVPMPASKIRNRQPVAEIAEALGKIVEVPVFTKLLLKANTGKLLKDLHTKEEKVEAIGDSFSVNDEIGTEGAWNVLIVDDLFDTGASMEAACRVLREYPKVEKIYVAALTWK